MQQLGFRFSIYSILQSSQSNKKLQKHRKIMPESSVSFLNLIPTPPLAANRFVLSVRIDKQSKIFSIFQLILSFFIVLRILNNK